MIRFLVALILTISMLGVASAHDYRHRYRSYYGPRAYDYDYDRDWRGREYYRPYGGYWRGPTYYGYGPYPQPYPPRGGVYFVW